MNCKKYKLIFFILSYWFIKVETFTPLGRYGHSSVHVENKLYFFGGTFDGFSCQNEVFYLDLSQQFNVELPLWTDLTLKSGLGFKSCWAATTLINHDNNPTIYLVGGIMNNQNNEDTFTSLVYTFNLKSEQWNIPVMKGKLPERRRTFQAVADDFGNIFVFGGGADAFVGSIVTQYFNDMAILNTHDSTWSYGPIVNAPLPRAGFTATLLSNGIIIYIGGLEILNDNTGRIVDINQLSLYDTKLSSWSVVQAKINGQIESRGLHSAVLVSDGRIIIYGGAKDIGSIKVFPDLAVLNTSASPFEWTVPQVSNNGEVPSLTGHTANLVGDYMIVAFGKMTQPNAPPSGISSRIYLLDIRSYTWVDKFVPEPIPTNQTLSNPSTTTDSAKPTLTTETTNRLSQEMKVIIGTISGIACVAILSAIGIVSYKWYQKRKSDDQVMRISGNI